MRDLKQYLLIMYKGKDNASSTVLASTKQDALAMAEFLLSTKDYDTNNKDYTNPYTHCRIDRIKGNGTVVTGDYYFYNETFNTVQKNYLEKY